MEDKIGSNSVKENSTVEAIILRSASTSPGVAHGCTIWNEYLSGW